MPKNRLQVIGHRLQNYFKVCLNYAYSYWKSYGKVFYLPPSSTTSRGPNVLYTSAPHNLNPVNTQVPHLFPPINNRLLYLLKTYFYTQSTHTTNEAS